MCRQEDVQRFVAMVGHPDRAALGHFEERRDCLVLCAIAVSDVDELVIDRHAMLLGVEGQALSALDLQLVELEVAEGADDGVDLAGDQRGREAEVDIDEGHVV